MLKMRRLQRNHALLAAACVLLLLLLYFLSSDTPSASIGAPPHTGSAPPHNTGSSAPPHTGSGALERLKAATLEHEKNGAQLHQITAVSERQNIAASTTDIDQLSAMDWLHPNAISRPRRMLDSDLDQRMAQLHCETKRCHSAIQQCDKETVRYLFKYALETGNQRFEDYDMEGAVAAYFLAFEPNGDPWALHKLDLSAVKQMGQAMSEDVLKSAFHFVEALDLVQLFGAADALASALIKEFSWSGLWEIRSMGAEHFRRYRLAYEHVKEAVQRKKAQCNETGLVLGRTLKVRGELAEIWLNESTPNGRWAPATPKDMILPNGNALTFSCKSSPVVQLPGAYCFRLQNSTEVWLPPNVLPHSRSPLSPPCGNQDPALHVRNHALHETWLNYFKKEADRRISDGSDVMYNSLYRPKKSAYDHDVHQADNIPGIMFSFKNQGYVAIADGLPRGWDLQMREYLLQFRTRLSTQAWSVSRDFRRHTTTYMKKPGFRNNLGLHLDEGPAGGNTTGELFAELFKSTPALREIFPDHAVLSEMGGFVVYPGAEEQIVHQDIKYKPGQPKVRAMFIQLGDTEEGQGNLRVWPGTHPQPAKRPMDNDFANRSSNTETIIFNKGNPESGAFPGVEIAPLQSRSVIVYESNLFHQGTANVKDRPRVILYLTAVIAHTEKEAKESARKWTISLLPEYKERGLTIKEIVEYVRPEEKVGWVGHTRTQQCVPAHQEKGNTLKKAWIPIKAS